MLTTYIVSLGLSNLTTNLSWLGAIAGVIGAPFGGYLTERLARGKVIPVILSNSLLVFLIIFSAFVNDLWLLVSFSLLMGFSYGMYAAPSMSLATELSEDDEQIGSASGFLNFSAQVGGIVAPIAISILVVTTKGFFFAYIIVGLVAFVFLFPAMTAAIMGKFSVLLSRT